MTDQSEHDPDDDDWQEEGAGEEEERAGDGALLPLPASDLSALLHFLDEQLGREACDHSLRLTETFLAEHRLDVDAVTEWLREAGGRCDCEVLAHLESEWGDRL